MATKKDLLEQAQEMGLEVSNSNTKEEIQAMIDQQSLEPTTVKDNTDPGQDVMLNNISQLYFEYGRLRARMTSLENRVNQIQTEYSEIDTRANQIFQEIVECENSLNS